MGTYRFRIEFDREWPTWPSGDLFQEAEHPVDDLGFGIDFQSCGTAPARSCSLPAHVARVAECNPPHHWPIRCSASAAVATGP